MNEAPIYVEPGNGSGGDDGPGGPVGTINPIHIYPGGVFEADPVVTPSDHGSGEQSLDMGGARGRTQVSQTATGSGANGGTVDAAAASANGFSLWGLLQTPVLGPLQVWHVGVLLIGGSLVYYFFFHGKKGRR